MYTCGQDIRSPKSSREDMTKLSKTKSKDKHRDHSEESQKSDKYADIHTSHQLCIPVSILIHK